MPFELPKTDYPNLTYGGLSGLLAGGLAPVPLQMGEVPGLAGLLSKFMQPFQNMAKERIANAAGIPSASMADALTTQSTISPLGLLEAGKKGEVPNLPIDFSAVPSETANAVKGKLQPILQRLAERHPRIVGAIDKITVAPHAGGWGLAFASVDRNAPNLNIADWLLNPNEPRVLKEMARLGLTPDQHDEFVTGVLEHELTHVTQGLLERRGLAKAFGVDTSDFELQAFSRGYDLIDAFKQQQMMSTPTFQGLLGLLTGGGAK